jgi:hypothetical protein
MQPEKLQLNRVQQNNKNALVILISLWTHSTAHNSQSSLLFIMELISEMAAKQERQTSTQWQLQRTTFEWAKCVRIGNKGDGIACKHYPKLSVFQIVKLKKLLAASTRNAQPKTSESPQHKFVSKQGRELCVLVEINLAVRAFKVRGKF